MRACRQRATSVDLFVVHDRLQVIRLSERVDFMRCLPGEVLEATIEDVLRLNLNVFITIRSDVITHTNKRNSSSGLPHRQHITVNV